MGAEELRRAAAEMRAKAEAARYGEWTTAGAQVMAVRIYGYEDVARCEGSAATEGNVLNALHIASWHPSVALAVADWLDGVALFVEARGDEEYFDLDGDPIAPEDTHAIGSALAVARAFLGGS